MLADNYALQYKVSTLVERPQHCLQPHKPFVIFARPIVDCYPHLVCFLRARPISGDVMMRRDYSLDIDGHLTVT